MMTRQETRLLHRRLVSYYERPHRRYYTRAKLRTDPLYNAVFESLNDRSQGLLDIGCGIGLFAFYLRERGYEQPITGVDYDEHKILEARAAAARTGAEGITFIHGDARETLPSFRGNVTILDVLQFFQPEVQTDLLRRAAASVAPGAALVIRSGLRESTWRFKLTRLGDAVARWTRWMKDSPTAYPTEQSLRETLEAEGLEGSLTPLWGKTPFSNYLIVFRRPKGVS